jgi:hypothetical protein
MSELKVQELSAELRDAIQSLVRLRAWKKQVSLPALVTVWPGSMACAVLAITK